MKNYNYKYIVTNNKVIALSSYAGKTVRGVAKCHPNDVFDEEFGKKLAAARCNLKIAEKRHLRAKNRYDKTADEYVRICNLLKSDSDFLSDTYIKESNARVELENLYNMI